MVSRFLIVRVGYLLMQPHQPWGVSCPQKSCPLETLNHVSTVFVFVIMGEENLAVIIMVHPILLILPRFVPRVPRIIHRKRLGLC